MPLFGGGSGDATTWEPQAADGRLAHTAGATPDGVFTSDLSVSEYALLGEAGFEPLGFVVGSSIFHICIRSDTPTMPSALSFRSSPRPCTAPVSSP
jgi:hypothetical protein